MRTPPPAPDIAHFDLNLLLAFEALWVERHVTRAGRRLHLSQSATSGALARLRTAMGDPLFVRSRTGLEPTERCSQLAVQFTKALADIRHALRGEAFEPATAQRSFTVGGVDAALAVLVPEVASRVMGEAPGVHLRVIPIDPKRAVDLVEAGSLDIALSPVVRPAATVRARSLFPLEFVWAARVGHPAFSQAKRFDTSPRMRVSFEAAPSTDAHLVVTSFLAVPHILSRCDAVVALPLPFARLLERQGQLRCLPPHRNHRLPTMTMQLLWPEAQHAAPASHWLRGLFVDAARRLTQGT